MKYDIPDDNKLKELVNKAFNALRRNLGISLTLDDAWTFKNSAGINTHVKFYDSSNKLFECVFPGKMFNLNLPIVDDQQSHALWLPDDQHKLIARLAFRLYNWYLANINKN